MDAQMSEFGSPLAPESDAGREVVLDGVRLDALTQAQVVQAVVDRAVAGRGGWVITANLDHMRRARHDAGYRQMLSEADFVVADGMPLIWASRLGGRPLPERVAGSSMVEPMAKLAAERGLSLFLLGGNPGIAEQAAQILKQRYPGLVVKGTACPPMGFENDPQYMKTMREELSKACPDLVYVALGSPKQENLIREIRNDLPRAWWVGIGISLSFLTGEVQRAPSWMQRLGLEWLHRMVQEPRRLAKRYLVDGLPYAIVLLTTGFLSRFRGGGS